MQYFRIAVDCVILGYDNDTSQLKVLFTKRIQEPQQGQWALPGGFVTQTESFEETAQAILKRETGIDDIYLRQLRAFSLTDASAENRIASVVYFSLVNWDTLAAQAGTQDSHWYPVTDYPALPFDHGEKVVETLARIKEVVRLEPIVYHLLPAKFTLNQLQRFYEVLFGTSLDNRNFRKKIKKQAYLEQLDELEQNVSHRPGHLYRFIPEKYQPDLTPF
ncbi:MAG: NUDIX domain-containing protein [Bacteroidota bacterium]